jgi:hypothetical protein
MQQSGIAKTCPAHPLRPAVACHATLLGLDLSAGKGKELTADFGGHTPAL